MNATDQLLETGWQILGVALCGGGRALQITSEIVSNCGVALEHLGQQLKTPAPPQ